jgi:DNA-binding transcriptional MerR regulator
MDTSQEFESTHLRTALHITGETLRQWSREFKAYLSPGANPAQARKHRLFTYSDFEIMTLVWEYRQRNRPWDEIHAAIQRGDRAVPPETPSELEIIQTQTEIERLQARIDTLVSIGESLRAQIVAANTRADRAEGAQAKLDEQLTAANEEIIRLRIELHRRDMGK